MLLKRTKHLHILPSDDDNFGGGNGEDYHETLVSFHNNAPV